MSSIELKSLPALRFVLQRRLLRYSRPLMFHTKL
jgi:hypothetical protein